MNQFVSDLATGNYWSGLGQYGVGTATLAGHVVIDMKAWPTPNSKNPGKAFTEAQMQTQLTVWLDKGVVTPKPAGAEQNGSAQTEFYCTEESASSDTTSGD